MDYGKALRIARAISGLQQKEVAELAGLDTSYVSLIEGGKRRPGAQVLSDLCAAVGIPEPLFMLLGAEPKELNAKDPDEIRRTAELLARLILGERPKYRRGRRRAS